MMTVRNSVVRKLETMTIEKDVGDLVAHHGRVVATAEVPHEAKEEVHQKSSSKKCESECRSLCSSALSRAVRDRDPAAAVLQKNRSRKCGSECSDTCSSVLSRVVPAAAQAVGRHVTATKLVRQCVNVFRNT